MAPNDHTSGKSPQAAGPVLRDAALGAGGRSEDLSVQSEEPHLRMPQPEVREAPDAGAIHWHEQVEPGIPDPDDVADPR